MKDTVDMIDKLQEQMSSKCFKGKGNNVKIVKREKKTQWPDKFHLFSFVKNLWTLNIKRPTIYNIQQ